MATRATQIVPLRFSVSRLRLDQGGYDSTGAYWGHGQPLYQFASDCGQDGTCRADDRDGAKAHVSRHWPGATFYR